MSFVLLLIVAIVVFAIVSRARRRARRSGTTANVARSARQDERQALRALLEDEIKPGADVREIMRAVRTAKAEIPANESNVSVTFSRSGNSSQLADSVRAALAAASVAAAEQIVAWCRQNLTNYKVPKIVEFRNELPKTPVGKILRRELRASAVAQPVP